MHQPLPGDEDVERVRTPAHSLGRPAIPLDHALRLAADLEDAEIRQELSDGQ